MSRDEFYAFKLAVQVLGGVCIVVALVVNAIVPSAFTNPLFLWALGILLLTYVYISAGPLQRIILRFVKRRSKE